MYNVISQNDNILINNVLFNDDEIVIDFYSSRDDLLVDFFIENENDISKKIFTSKSNVNKVTIKNNQNENFYIKARLRSFSNNVSKFFNYPEKIKINKKHTFNISLPVKNSSYIYNIPVSIESDSIHKYIAFVRIKNADGDYYTLGSFSFKEKIEEELEILKNEYSDIKIDIYYGGDLVYSKLIDNIKIKRYETVSVKTSTDDFGVSKFNDHTVYSNKRDIKLELNDYYNVEMSEFINDEYSDFVDYGNNKVVEFKTNEDGKRYIVFKIEDEYGNTSKEYDNIVFGTLFKKINSDDSFCYNVKNKKIEIYESEVFLNGKSIYSTSNSIISSIKNRDVIYMLEKNIGVNKIIKLENFNTKEIKDSLDEILNLVMFNGSISYIDENNKLFIENEGDFVESLDFGLDVFSFSNFDKYLSISNDETIKIIDKDMGIHEVRM